MQNRPQVLGATGSLEIMRPLWEPLLLGGVSPKVITLLLGILKLHSAVASSVAACLTTVVECTPACKKQTRNPGLYPSTIKTELTGTFLYLPH